MKTTIKTSLALLTMSLPLLTLEAEVSTPRFISDGMMLQRGGTARIWGKADPGEAVTVTFLKKKYSTTSGDDGRWSVDIPTTKLKKGGGPYTLQINDRTLQDVWVGDVWLCSGQSNMDLHCARLVDLYKQEFDTYTNPAIHLVQTGRNPSIGELKDDVDAGGFYAWESLAPERVGHWSGIGYFFAREMYDRTGGVPQGIISASMGGSDIAAWCSEEVLAEKAPYKIEEMNYFLEEGYRQRAGELSRAIGPTYSRLRDEQDPGLKGQWMAADIDLSEWEDFDQFAPRIGDKYGRPWVGSLWLRREFDVPADMVGKDSLLRLGCMVDADVTYVNGVKVGETGYQYPPRKYTLPEGLIKAGRNVVTVRLMSGGAPMSFVPEKPYKLIFHGGKEISLEGQWKLRRGVMMPNQPGVRGVSNATGTSLYSNVIHPLLPYRVAGILWYQGESNAGRDAEYHRLLPAMITDWRKSYGEVPAIIFGLANHQQRHADANTRSGLAAMREAQRLSANELSGAAYVNMIDLGEWNDIHPLNKREAARRAALQMQRLYLGNNKEVSEGPAYQGVRFADGKAHVSFRQGTAIGLEIRPATPHSIKDPLMVSNGFSIAGDDGVFLWAEAEVDGEEVVIWSPEVTNPVAVRYAWDDDPIVTLYNAAGLPAASFSTK